MNVFRPVTESEVKTIIKKTVVKTCILDPLPTSLLSHVLDDLLPYFTRIVNDSLSTGCFPDVFKSAVICPLLKKPSLDQDILKNYRPVSNLPFLSKIVEKVVMAQLSEHLQTNNLFYPLQSAYRAGHSTETALIKIVNDLLISLDENQISLLSLLDLSAAFDTIDHSILLSRLHSTFGISDTALKWFQSYLSDRTQQVSINDSLSTPAPLRFGVPQGSVLGPLLFILYTHPLSEIVTQHSLSHHSYSDDNQVYTSCSLSDLPSIIASTQSCISNIQSWMSTNKLQLNSDKTELIFIAPSRFSSSNVSPKTIQLDDHFITPSQVVRNLGVMLDQKLSFNQYISSICRACYFELRRISSVRHLLSENATKTLICAFVLSRLDYCNALLSGCPNNLLHRLQKIQNNAARLVFQCSRNTHVTPLLRSLHWLPVAKRIQYKLSVLCFKSFDSSAPDYLSDLLHVYTPSRQLRSSSDTRLLSVPTMRTKTNGERSFLFQAPTVWNSLPKSVRHSSSLQSFKTSLKTYLFST